MNSHWQKKKSMNKAKRLDRVSFIMDGGDMICSLNTGAKNSQGGFRSSLGVDWEGPWKTC